MSGEAAAKLSASILAERGLGNQADGAGKGGEAPAGDNPGANEPTGSPAGDNRDDGGTSDPAGEKDATAQENQGWMSSLPESLQRDFKKLSPEQQVAVRELAEGNMRQADYTRKTQEAKREAALARKKAAALDEILSDPEARARLMGKTQAAAGHEGEESTVPSITDLMKVEDPTEFAEGLDAVINSRIERANEARQAASPEAKAAKINEAAEVVRQELGDKINDEVWKRASELFVEQFDSFGEHWWESDPSRVAFNLRGPIRQALLEAKAAEQSAASRTAGGDTGVRETSIQGDLGSVRTEPGEKPVSGRNAEEIMDNAYERTMKRFGLQGEDDLKRLRNLG